MRTRCTAGCVNACARSAPRHAHRLGASFRGASMIDHTGVGVSDFARSKAFYTAALAPIGYTLLMELSAAVTGSVDTAGFGEAPKPDFWIRVGSRAVVDAFHRAALAAGGSDNGAPGLRPHYHANYYGAFVRDPDGHNIEAV